MIKWHERVPQGDLWAAFALLLLLWAIICHQYYTPLTTSLSGMGYQLAQVSDGGGDGTTTPPVAPSATDPQGLADGAHVLFVDQSNSACSDTNTRTQALAPATPWCTPRGMNQGLQSGDTVYIKEGTYLLGDITTTNRILVRVNNFTLAAYPGDNVTIAGSTATMSGVAPSGFSDDNTIITFYQTNNLKIEGITFRGYVDGPSGRLYIPHIVNISSANNVEVRDSQFLDYQGSDDIGYGQRGAGVAEGWGHSLRFYNVDGIVVDGVTVRGIEDPSKLVPDRYGGDGIICDNCRNMEVSNSQFLDTSHVSLNFRNSRNIVVQDSDINNRLHTGADVSTIAGNAGTTGSIIFQNNRFFGYNQFMSQPVGTALRGGGLQIGPGTMSDLLVANNLFYDGYNDSTGVAVGTNPGSTISNVRIYYNTFYQPGSRAIYLSNNVDPGSNVLTNIKIKNNLIYRVKQQAGQNTGYNYNREIVVAAYNFEENNGYGTEIKNNLIVPLNADGAAVVSAQLSGNGQIPVRYTYTVPTLNTKSFAGNNISIDPGLDNPQSGNLRLTASTPAMYAAECLDEVGRDFANKSRDSGPGCTVGAYEYDPAAPPGVPAPPRPTATPASGNYPITQHVALASEGAASIRYNSGAATVSSPTCSSGTIYSSPITVSSYTKIRAVACSSSGRASSVASFSYSIGDNALTNEQGGDEAPVPPAPLNVPTVPNQISPDLLQILLQLFGLGSGQAGPAPAVVARVLQINHDLTLNATGDDVVALQNYLIDRLKGPAAISLRNKGATGYFGPLTVAALAEYQRFVGISPATGYYGPRTRSYLVRAWSQ